MFKKYFPIYINTLNIFKPFKTWFKHKDILKFPKIKFNFYKCPFKDFTNKFYTWYWWDHQYIWNFEKKWLIILIDDVQYKLKYGIIELESVPFIFIKIFNLHFLITLNSPNDNNYQYWESFKKYIK